MSQRDPEWTRESRPRRSFRHAGALAALLVSCGSAPAQPSPASSTMPDGGPNLIVAPVNCPDVSTLVPADAGACVISKKRSFAVDVAPLFEGCSGEICHFFGGGAIAKQVGIAADECCNEILIIDPGHPERSYLMNKLLGRNLCLGSRMPLDQPPFPSDATQVVSDWICAGADSPP